MSETDHNAPAAPAVGPRLDGGVGRPAPEREYGDLTAECAYCKERLHGWRIAEGAVGKRWRNGVLEYHCYGAYCWD